VNAYTVKKHREGDQLDRSKDDRRDAGQIAELSRNGKTCPGYLTHPVNILGFSMKILSEVGSVY